MGTDTKIEWADHTWNPWYGCTPVSEGCEHCYALRRMTQLKRVKGPGDIRRSSKTTWRFPLSKKVKSGDRVFVCSWSDFFHPQVCDVTRADAVELMLHRPDVTFLLLTKRCVELARWVETAYWFPRALQKSIWLGVTAENQARADERIPVLLSIDWAGKKFVSLEPMLGPVDVARSVPPFRDCPHYAGGCIRPENPFANTSNPRERPGLESCREAYCVFGRQGLDWVIAGGESGPNARPMNPAWARGVRDQCVEAGVPFFFKQWGEWMSTESFVASPDRVQPKPYPALGSRRCLYDFDSASAGISGRSQLLFVGSAPEDMAFARVGKKRAGRLLDHRTWDEVPG